MMVHWTFACWALLVACVQGAAEQQVALAGDWITQEDLDMSAKAKVRVTEYCTAANAAGEDIDRSQRREDLLSAVGGTNIVDEALTEAKDEDELGEKLQDKLSPGFLIGKGGPIVMFIILIPVFLICCWTCCPCCRCCRCGAKERHTNPIVKLIALMLAVGICVGVVIAGIIAFTGYSAGADGADTFACAGSQLVSSLLDGEKDPAFPFYGMLPLLSTFWDMSNLLAEDSSFITKVTAELDKTAPIEKSILIATETLKLLSDILQQPGNLHPVLSTGAKSYHTCKLCEEMGPKVNKVISALEDGVGTQLAKTRNEVKRQLTGDTGKQFQTSLREAGNPLNDVKNMISESIGELFVKGDTAELIKTNISGQAGMGGCLLLIVFGLLLGLCGCGSTGLWVATDRAPKGEASDGVKQNPHPRSVHRFSCCAWNCGFLFTMLAFLFGGVLTMVNVPLGSLCLVMDGISDDKIRGYLPALGTNMSADAFGTDMLLGIIDGCFENEDPSMSANLLDVLKVKENGTTITMKEKIVDQVEGQINKQFDDTFAKMQNQSGGLADHEDTQTLVNFLRDTSFDAFIIPDESDINDLKTSLPALFAGFGSSGAEFLASSVACTISASSPPSAGATTTTTSYPKTVEEFLVQYDDVLKSNGHAAGLPSTSCPTLGSVLPVPVGCASDICTQGTTYIKYKQGVMDHLNKRFNCIHFKRNNQRCDILDMSKSPSGWANDCVTTESDGSMKMLRVDEPCNLAEFTTYMSEFGERIDKVFTRVDTTVAATQDSITVGLKGLVDEHIIAPIQRIASKVSCGFLTRTYRSFIDGLCFQVVWGLDSIARGYVACGALGLVFTILMYAVWRRSIDSYNDWAQKHKDGTSNGTGEQPAQQAAQPASAEKQQAAEKQADEPSQPTAATEDNAVKETKETPSEEVCNV